MSEENKYIARMVTIYDEIGVLEDDIKGIKDEAKDKGYDPVLLAQVAKSKSNQKLDTLKDKSINLIKMIDSL